MKYLTQKLTPALILTLTIGGSVGANIVGHKQNLKRTTTWLGVRADNSTVMLNNQPDDPCCLQNPTKICYYTLADDNAPVPTFNGPYDCPQK